MSQPKDVRVDVNVRARNTFILRKMEENGLKNVTELCRALDEAGLKISRTELDKLIDMRLSARRKGCRGFEWRTAALKLAQFFKCTPEHLFSEQQQRRCLGEKKQRLSVEVAFADIETSRPDWRYERQELIRILDHLLSTVLVPDEERVLRMRFGVGFDKMHTSTEVGTAFGIERDDARRIEARALYRLKVAGKEVLGPFLEIFH